jgi:adenosylhomocysteine nucleosidase
MSAILVFLFISTHKPALIGVMSAMEMELDFLGQAMEVLSTDTVASKVFRLGTIEGMRCVTVPSGIGKVDAAQTAQTLIMRYGVDAVIFTGVAGGINPQLHIGDIVISSNVVHHDFGQILPKLFIPFDTIGFPADSFLCVLAWQAARGVELEPIPSSIRGDSNRPTIILGRVATGDQFISSEAKRQWIESTFHADCVEMEGAAVAQVCTVNGIPFVIIRSLSDLANEKAELDFESFVNYAAKNSSLLVKKMLQLLSEQ